MGNSSKNSVIAGAGCGLVASIATCPLDVIKTRLQAQRETHGQQGYKGIAATVKTILKHDGIRGLYRGLGPTILGYLPTWAIYFTVYDGIKNHFGPKPLQDIPPESVQKIYPAPHVKGYQPVAREHPWTLHILSAMTAGATSTLCTNPLWVIKTRFMTQSYSEVRYKHTLDAAITIYRMEGWRAFFRGLLPSLLGILHVAVQFPLYEQLKDWARERKGHHDLAPSEILFCSSIAKMTASVATYPHEVIRTRLQTTRISRDAYQAGVLERPNTGIIRTAKNIIVHEGGRGLYKGLSINLARTVPNSAITMLTYEMIMKWLNARTSSN